MSRSIEDARLLLQRLRTRTEKRGATPAEAAQAVELAERIIERYGLDDVTGDAPDTEHRAEVETDRLPWWAESIAFSISQRFRCRGHRCYEPHLCLVVFTGPEHRSSVACWLFGAVMADLESRSAREAKEATALPSERVRFRRRFLEAAALQLADRLMPVEMAAALETAGNHRCAKRVPRITITDSDLVAMAAGASFGREVSLGTNAIGDRRGPVLAIGERREGR